MGATARFGDARNARRRTAERLGGHHVRGCRRLSGRPYVVRRQSLFGLRRGRTVHDVDGCGRICDLLDQRKLRYDGVLERRHRRFRLVHPPQCGRQHEGLVVFLPEPMQRLQRFRRRGCAPGRCGLWRVRQFRRRLRLRRRVQCGLHELSGFRSKLRVRSPTFGSAIRPTPTV